MVRVEIDEEPQPYGWESDDESISEVGWCVEIPGELYWGDADCCEVDVRCKTRIVANNLGSIPLSKDHSADTRDRGFLLNFFRFRHDAHLIGFSFRPLTISSRDTPLTLMTLNRTPGRSPYERPMPDRISFRASAH